MDDKHGFSLGKTQRRISTWMPPQVRVASQRDRFVVTERAQTVRILRGAYKNKIWDAETGEGLEEILPYFKVRRHWDVGLKQWMTCSADNPYNPRPCIGCAKAENAKKYKGPSVSTSTHNVFSILQLDWFHKVPWIKDERMVIGHDGQPVLIDALCEGKNCKKCNTDIPKFFGKALFWALSNVHLDQVIAEENKIKSFCECGKELDITSYSCPLCQTVLVNMAITGLSETELEEAYNRGLFCATCNRIVQVVENVDCPKSENGCGSARPIDIFKVNMRVKRIPIERSDNYNLSVVFTKPCPIDPMYTGKAEPLDLLEIFQELPIDQQRRLLKYQETGLNVVPPTESYSDVDPDKHT